MATTMDTLSHKAQRAAFGVALDMALKHIEKDTSKGLLDVLDISQTIVQDYFNMMMIADMEHATGSFDEIASELEKVGEEIGVAIKCQREEIFTKMHRI